MSSFDETKHPRGQAGNPGQFSSKNNDAPAGSLGNTSNAPGAPMGPLKVTLLPEPDPRGGFDTRVDAPTGRHYLRGNVPHREDGPAYEGNDGSEVYYQHGELHRDPADGPAVIDEYEGDLVEEFYSHGQLVTP